MVNQGMPPVAKKRGKTMKQTIGIVFKRLMSMPVKDLKKLVRKHHNGTWAKVLEDPNIILAPRPRRGRKKS